jgi:hypothetical protein
MKVKVIKDVIENGLGIKQGDIFDVITDGKLRYLVTNGKLVIAMPKEYVEEYEIKCRGCKNANGYTGETVAYCSIKCFNYDKYETIEKEIELPNEFYFKYFKDNKEYKAIKRDEEYAIYGVKDLGYCYDYSLDICKKSINDKEWIIIETPTDNDNKIELDEFKKVSKFIALTTTEDFKVFIAKDKIVSVLQYEDKCFITTVAIEGIFTVREKSVDIIKMLEE